MTSSERSLRLCAFSVFRARICHATSRSGMTSAVMDLAPRRRMASWRWEEWKVAWDDRRGAPCTDPPHSPQPSRLLLRLPRQILLTALTCTVLDRGPWYRAWLCEDVVGQVRALPSRDSTLFLQRVSGRQGRFLITRALSLAKRGCPCSALAKDGTCISSWSALAVTLYCGASCGEAGRIYPSIH